VHATFWLGIEQRSNRRRHLVPDESGNRYTGHVPESGAGKTESIYGSISGTCVKGKAVEDKVKKSKVDNLYRGSMRSRSLQNRYYNRPTRSPCSLDP